MNYVYLYIALMMAMSSVGAAQTSDNEAIQWSIDFLQAIKAKKATSEIKQQLSAYTEEELVQLLDTDTKRLAFWINIYNGYIQDILGQDPALYEDRKAFFKEPYIAIAGRQLAFADIEHGIIRKSQFELFLGYLTNPFAPSYQKNLRVNKKDFRIHFALNCGAISCPPVGIYSDEGLDSQLDAMTKQYLTETTSYDAEQGLAKVVSLFSWFRGDFDGGDGIRDILLRYDVTPQRPSKVETTPYDWTLELDNWR